MMEKALVNTTGKAGTLVEMLLVKFGISKGEFAKRLDMVSSSVSRALKSETMEYKTLERYVKAIGCTCEPSGDTVIIYRDEQYVDSFTVNGMMETGKHNPNFKTA